MESKSVIDDIPIDFNIGKPTIGIYYDDTAKDIMDTFSPRRFEEHPKGLKTEILDIGPIEKGREYLRIGSGNLNTLCQGGLPPNYVKSEIEDEDYTNIIIILRDGDGAIRGTALLEVDDDQMILLVLCCAMRPTQKLRKSKIYGRGGELIKLIQFLGKDLKNGIKLYALETVIPLYHYFNWKFVKSCDARERPYIKPLVADLKDYLKKHQLDLGDKDTPELEGLLTGFRGSAKGRAELIRKGKAIKKEATEEARSDGYEMLLCKNDNPYSSDGKGEGKKRRRKKSTKKKAPKKKHQKKKQRTKRQRNKNKSRRKKKN